MRLRELGLGKLRGFRDGPQGPQPLWALARGCARPASHSVCSKCETDPGGPLFFVEEPLLSRTVLSEIARIQQALQLLVEGLAI